MIELKKISYQYAKSDNQALHDITFDIPKAKLLGLLGPNGAGKTTLISLLSGCLPLQQGEILINGKTLSIALKNNKSLIGYIPQDYAFYPRLSARENLNFFAGIQGIKSTLKNQRIENSLQFCQLESVADQRAETFSGGLKRRLNIAIGLLSDPDILILDEPTVGIDPQSRAFILQQVKELQQQGKTIIYTSHYMEEIEQICDDIAIIDDGRLRLHGNTQQLKNDRQNLLQLALGSALTPQQQEYLRLRYQVNVNAANKLTFPALDNATECQLLIAELIQQDLSITSIQYGHSSLEQLFLDITHKKLRD